MIQIKRQPIATIIILHTFIEAWLEINESGSHMFRKREPIYQWFDLTRAAMMINDLNSTYLMMIPSSI